MEKYEKHELNLYPEMEPEKFRELQDSISVGYNHLFPIIIYEKKILDGWNRYKACCDMHVTPTIRPFSGTREEALNFVIMTNKRRDLTASQRACLASEYLPLFEAEAKKRLIQSGKETGRGNIKVVEKIPQPFNEKSRQQSGEMFNVNEKYVSDAKHIKKEDPEIYEKVKTGELNIPQAKKEIKEKEEINKDKLSTFNSTNDNIEWAKWSWNPVTGCLHGCKFCYARDIANRFFGGFEPRFYPERLQMPHNTKYPQDKIELDVSYKNVFVCSMSDLFGDWVENDWINQILKSIKENPQWNYLFLTKNPEKYLEFDFPDNCWLGVTVHTQNMVKRAENVLRQFPNNISFVSCEPLKEKIIFNSLENIDMVIVGGQSKSTQEQEFQPEWDWVESLLNQVRKFNKNIYFKPNLKVRPREYPRGTDEKRKKL